MNLAFKRLIALILVTFTATAFAAKDPADLEETEEHPEIARFPGFYIDNSKRNDFNEFQFASKANPDDGETKEGKYWFVDYILKEGVRQPSTVELIRNYENAFRKAGGSLVRRHGEVAVFRVPRADGERWVQISVDNGGYRYQLHIVDVAAMAQKVEFSAGEMAAAIKATGFVALNGIVFDTGKATIKPESEALLAEVVSLLKNDRQLKLSVEGHTDNVGDKKSNAELSLKRAESVVKYLEGKGIDAKRLKSAGKGDAAPVADNRTDAGRARNRRVELVKF
ncbi:MAG TPA: OmpA family protein [Noviherbaspirillum sp.]|uniref:OmpA family protein n=1 Tax=Noviherbaspirillum sp. TaxID=1926288 RepID=UPI002D6B5D74|nr:OmpA family protein [Noviherbaspirillum sp.]HYD94942.1 OmpA family protein [Noviherbaspirillum sp.]